MRVVSLVPSLTDTLAELGVADRLVGVTDYCVHGAPDAAARIGGTKNPSVPEVAALRPDLVLVNTEENRAEDIARLRGEGLRVLELHPRTVDDVDAMLATLGECLGLDAGHCREALEAARDEVRATRPATPIAALTLIWRKPWMGVGPGTYVDALLGECGFANVLAGFDDPYPKLDEALVLRPQVVLLPSEPYAFSTADLDAVRTFLGDVECRFVDGELLTWHGHRTAAALRTFGALARDLAT